MIAKEMDIVIFTISFNISQVDVKPRDIGFLRCMRRCVEITMIVTDKRILLQVNKKLKVLFRWTWMYSLWGFSISAAIRSRRKFSSQEKWKVQKSFQYPAFYLYTWCLVWKIINSILRSSNREYLPWKRLSFFDLSFFIFFNTLSSCWISIAKILIGNR